MYQQTYGTAMWWPESVTIANPIMEDVEETALATTNVPFWKWYFDDTCTALTVHRLQKLLDHLNRVEFSIQFTVETKSEEKLPLSGCTVVVRHGRNCTLIVKLNWMILMGFTESRAAVTLDWYSLEGICKWFDVRTYPFKENHSACIFAVSQTLQVATTDLYYGQLTDNLLKFWETIECWINLRLPHDGYLKANSKHLDCNSGPPTMAVTLWP